KGGELAGLAAPGPAPPHQGRGLAGEGGADPRPAVAARGQRICLREILEQLRLLFGGQADAGIRDSKLGPVAAVRHLAAACGCMRLSTMDSESLPTRMGRGGGSTAGPAMTSPAASR